MKTQADKKSVKDIQELKQRFTKFSIGLFAILTLSITFWHQHIHIFYKNRIQISPLKRNSNVIWKMQMQSINWQIKNRK